METSNINIYQNYANILSYLSKCQNNGNMFSYISVHQKCVNMLSYINVHISYGNIVYYIDILYNHDNIISYINNIRIMAIFYTTSLYFRIMAIFNLKLIYKYMHARIMELCYLTSTKRATIGGPMMSRHSQSTVHTSIPKGIYSLVVIFKRVRTPCRPLWISAYHVAVKVCLQCVIVAFPSHTHFFMEMPKSYILIHNNYSNSVLIVYTSEMWQFLDQIRA